jgi:hypothetical protein
MVVENAQNEHKIGLMSLSDNLRFLSNGETQGHLDRHSRGGGSPEKLVNTGFLPSRE